MLQNIIVILLIAGCCLWLGLQAFRFLRPRPGQKACAGGCCDGQEPKPAAATGPRTMMISSDDLRTRLAARKK